MLDKTHYQNGQKIYKHEKDYLTYYFKTGIVKSEGKFINGQMEGLWKFYRENGDLWQTGHFEKDMKNGNWKRYDRSGKVEYDENFLHGKILKNKKA